MKSTTDKKKIELWLKENKIRAKVTITKNRIDIHNIDDMKKVSDHYPNMSVSYGFLN